MINKTENSLSLEEQKAVANIFTNEYYELAYFRGITYVSYLILQLFESIGVLGLLKDKYSSAVEIMAAFNFVPKAKYALEWMLNFLSQNNFLEKLEDKDARKYHYQRADIIDTQSLLKEGIELDKKIIPSANLMNYVISEYPNFFCGRKKGFEILFASDKMALCNDYFSNDNSGYNVYNYLGALAVSKWAFKGNSIRLLELGGGTGGASSALIEELKSKNLLSRISEYIFSDVSPIFLRLGNRAIMSRVSDSFNYSLKKLDFDKPLLEQNMGENEIDVVYAVNALHVAKNLVGSLKNIYRVLKPGGLIVFCEYCRPNIDYLLLQEFIFCLLDNYVEVDLDSNLRPVPGFLDYAHWQRNLEVAGFKNIEAIFNTDGAYHISLKGNPGILAAAIKGEK